MPYPEEALLRMSLKEKEDGDETAVAMGILDWDAIFLATVHNVM